MTGIVRYLLIVIGFTALSGCAGSSSTPWTDMKHLYDNEIAPTQSRIASLESQVVENEREIADLKTKIRELRKGRASDSADDQPPISDTSPTPSGRRLLSSEMLERDRSLNRAYDPDDIDTSRAAEAAFPDVMETGVTDTQSALYAIHLASYGSLKKAAEGWRILTAAYPDTLLSMTPWTKSVRKSDSGKIFYRLLAGPLTNRDRAARACAAMTAEGAYCKAMPFEGDPLMVE